MNLHELILTKNDCYKANRWIKPKGVMVHSTGANNPNLKRYVGPDDGLLGPNYNNNHWNMSGTGACVHGFIGKLKDGTIASYQTLPWNMRGWHAGTGTSGKSANNTHISFEICEDGLRDPTYFNKVYKEAVELTAYLCMMYDLNPLEDGVVICHSEGYRRGIASNHADVMHWFPKFGKSMDTFRQDVSSIIKTGGLFMDEKTIKKFVEDIPSELAYKLVMKAMNYASTLKVPEGDWQEPGLATCKEKGIMAGDKSGNQMAYKFCTRGELATMLARMLELK